MARHFNYLGEITQALALALPSVLVGCHSTATASAAASSAAAPLSLAPYVSLLYPLYYVLLFVPRQLDDDAVCALKYGEDWAEYVRTVPWRICPGVW